MNSISFKLEIFEGPLDLLLSLISKHQLNIQDIEISKLLEQYLKYIEECNDQNFDLAGEFLEMAARLIYIKTASLLPAQEEAQKLKKELEGALIEYSLCKQASKYLSSKFIGDKIFVRKAMKIKINPQYSLIHEPNRLITAYEGISHRKIPNDNFNVIENKINSIVKTKTVSVITKVIFVLRQLYTTGKACINNLYDDITDKSERVATFLAILELTKKGRIYISDDNTMIYFKGTRTKKKELKKDGD